MGPQFYLSRGFLDKIWPSAEAEGGRDQGRDPKLGTFGIFEFFQ